MGKNTKTRETLEEVQEALADIMLQADWPETRKVDVTRRDHDGDTPLQKAVWQSNRPAVRPPIETGVALDAQGDMGETALHGAICKRDLEVIRLFLAAGAELHIRSEFDGTGWETAKRSPEPVLRLISEGQA